MPLSYGLVPHLSKKLSKLPHLVVPSQFLNTIVEPNFSPSWSEPQLLTIMVGPQLLTIMVGPQLLTIMVGPQLKLSASMVDNPTICLHGSRLTPNSLFQNLQILRIIASGHDIIHPPATFPIWSLL